jgi:two-component system sensor histidine kinase RegB
MNVRVHPAAPEGLDTAAPGGVQGVWATGEVNHSRLRVRTLVTLRWLLVGGQFVVLAGLGLILGYEAPYLLCALVLGASGFLNLLTSLATPMQRVMRDREAAGQLTFDILQISTMLLLLGGAGNPFMVALIVPVTLAAATLPLRSVLILGGLAAVLSFALALAPLPGVSTNFGLAMGRKVAIASANVATMILLAAFIRQSAEEAARMALALDVTQAVLSREQRLSALGTLAAAAAHELGTPLATIAIVAKEMAREAKTAEIKEDAELLIAQAQRCREILARLAETPDKAQDLMHERLTLRQLVQEVLEPHGEVQGVRLEAIVTGAKGVKAPDIRRLPEITHAMTSFVENALDFAKSEVLVTARFDENTISVEVRDDGAGFSPEVLATLGEPYVTTRPGAEGSRTGHIGMGLGFFIAKTLLERTGAKVTFGNGQPQGAVVAAKWNRSQIETAGASLTSI